MLLTPLTSLTFGHWYISETQLTVRTVRCIKKCDEQIIHFLAKCWHRGIHSLEMSAPKSHGQSQKHALTQWSCIFHSA